MPQVKTDTLMLQTGENFRRVFKVNSAGDFSVNFPKEAGEVVGCGSTLKAKALEKLEGIWSKNWDKYLKCRTQVTKVIIFNFQSTAFIQDENGDCLFRSRDISFIQGTALDLWWEVCNEKKIEVEGRSSYRYYTLDSDGDTFGVRCSGIFADSGRAQDNNRLEWSEEREEFFESLQNKLNQLILALDGLQSDKEKLIHCISNKMVIGGSDQSKMLEHQESDTQE